MNINILYSSTYCEKQFWWDRSNMEFFSGLYYFVKSVRNRSYSGPYFPAFGLNTERCSVSPHSVRVQENANQNNPEYGHFFLQCTLSLNTSKRGPEKFPIWSVLTRWYHRNPCILSKYLKLPYREYPHHSVFFLCLEHELMPISWQQIFKIYYTPIFWCCKKYIQAKL